MKHRAFDILIDLADVPWFQVDGDQRLTVWSPQIERLTGFTAEEVLGMPCVVGLRCDACLSGCGVFENNDVRNIPLRLYRKDGSRVAVYKSGRVLRDEDGAIVGAVEVVRPQAAVDAPVEMDRLLSAVGREWLRTDPSFHVRAWSGGLPTLLGRRPDSFDGLDIADLLGETLAGPGGTLRAALASGVRREWWRATLTRADGSELPVSGSAGNIPGLNGEPRGYFVLLRPELAAPETTDGEVPRFERMVGRSAVMQRIFRLIDLLRDNDATVLVTGESGTGKELVARALHSRSHRAERPFIAVNCGALPAELLESELFGHVRGAFTGAVRARIGRFEAAHGGTLFLDEIGDMPAPLQVKLLRVLQEHTFEPVGSSQPRQTDVRVIAATNRDLVQAVAEHRFRDDLYYRLRVVPISIPPLRDRREDLEVLVRDLLGRIGRRRARPIRLSAAAMRRLLAYPWPGNVRELENALEYAAAVCEADVIGERELPPELLEAPGLPSQSAMHGVAPAAPLAPSIATVRTLAPEEAEEATVIRDALVRAGYNRQRAALVLGMSRTTLWRKMKQLGL